MPLKAECPKQNILDDNLDQSSINQINYIWESATFPEIDILVF